MSDAHESHETDYWKIWGWLCGLLVISVAGPFLEIQVVTLLTAFGIAFVKAYMVVVHFMHINIAKRYIVYLTATTLIFMLLFFAAVAPDVMQEDGSNWVKPAWVAEAQTPPSLHEVENPHH